MTEHSQTAPLTRYDATLWFLRAVLLVQIVGLALSLVQMVLGYGLNVILPTAPMSSFIGVNLSSILPSAIGAAVMWLLAPAIARTAVGDKYSSGPLELRSLLLPCIGLALIAGSLGMILIQTFALGQTLLTRGFNLSAPTGGTFYPDGYVLWSWLSSVGRLVVGVLMIAVPALRARYRNAGI